MRKLVRCQSMSRFRDIVGAGSGFVIAGRTRIASDVADPRTCLLGILLSASNSDLLVVKKFIQVPRYF
jgi:hypothetical protein